MNVVVVESPAKAKTINKYLGPDYKVLASYGHVRDLPAKNGSVRPEEDFAMSWDVDAKSAKRLNEIAEAAKGAKTIILATDPDREGEAISWHVLEVLSKKKALKGARVQRVVFNAITKAAVTEAMKHPRDIDMELVDAYLARRALDYLVGFTLSPVLWRKLPGARSAGRVQSVSLRLIVDRELEIERFRTQEYWTVEADVSSGADPFLARLVKHDGKRLTKFDLGNEASARAAQAAVQAASFKISAVEKKPARRSPPPPFTTSTLQQEASRKLGFNAQRTMQAAQRLYEGVDIGGETVGLITYMRTDGVQTAPEAIDEARQTIAGLYGREYVPEHGRIYKTKAKNAQEAHEAIRPTALARNPGSLRLDSDLGRLYELIWKRMIASQMESARIERTTIDLESADGRRFADCAASVQRVLEDTLLDIARALRRDTGLPDLCFGGGVALNGVANARLLAESGFERVFVPPAPGDAGCAVGAALYADRLYFRNPDRDVPDHPFMGPRVDADELARVARDDGQRVEALDEPELLDRVADDLAAGRIVGWMDGAAEFGPRALGHRSILAAPHAVEMRDRLNRDIKSREEFRPFAPVVAVEDADRYFDLPPGGLRLARFMSGVFPVRPEWRERLAAVTHVDGTARLQVLDREMAPRLHDLLQAFGRRTGVPVLLNTSFNLAGEPIVNRATEGYSTFRRSGVDVLVAGGARVVKRALASAESLEEETA